MNDSCHYYISKRDNFSILKDIIDTQKPVKTKDGDTTITWLDNKFKVAYDDNNLDLAFPRNTPVFKTSNGNQIRLTDIEKTEVFGGGELMSFYDLTYRLLINEKYDENSFEMVGEQYIKRAEFLLTKQNKIADKLPNNYAFIGHIRKLSLIHI